MDEHKNDMLKHIEFMKQVSEAKKRLNKKLSESTQKNKNLVEGFIEPYCDQLEIKEPFISQAIKIAKNIDKIEIFKTNTPCVVAAGCIMLLLNMSNVYDFDKHFVAKKLSVSVITLCKIMIKIELYRQQRDDKFILLSKND
jgi:transcription initiation factor TFIIIB Brf1 subunit/transcription initiation factor TFIIB